MGDVHSPTTAVTANLFLYTDRGYTGSLRYGAKRVLVQLVQGLFVVGLIFPCKYFQWPVPDVVLIIVASCVALCVGLPINYKNAYSPLNCTLANATFVIACATVQNINAYPKRVLQCIVGFAIGYFVNYIVFSHVDRVAEIERAIRQCVNRLIHAADTETYYSSMPQIEKNIGLLVEDGSKNGRKLHISREKIDELQMHRKRLVALKDYVEYYAANQRSFHAKFDEKLRQTFAQVSLAHLRMTEFEETASAPVALAVPTFEMTNPAEVCAAERLIEYINLMNG